MNRRSVLRRRLQPRTLGQALVETALVAPFLVLLLLGGAQVGSIAYDQVSLDTAAREGARAGAASPTGAVFSTALNVRWYSAGNPATYTYNCKAADFTVNPICVGVVNSAGFLSQNVFTSNPCGAQQGCVTITVVPPASLQAQRSGPPALRLVSAPQAASPASAASMASKSCTPGNQMEVDGTVSGIPGGFSPGSLVDTKGSSGAPNNLTSPSTTYAWCVNASKAASNDTITAQIGPVGCGGYTGSVTVSVTAGGSPTTGDISVSAEPACTTSTTSTTTSSTTTSSSSSSTTTATTTSSAVTGPATGCADHPVDDSYYFTVSVTYPAPIFIPFINNLFQTSSGVRMITASVTFPVDPCTMTDFGKN